MEQEQAAAPQPEEAVAQAAVTTGGLPARPG